MRYFTVLKTVFNVQKNGVDNEQKILLTDAESFKKGLVEQHHDTELHDKNQKTGVSFQITCLKFHASLSFAVAFSLFRPVWIDTLQKGYVLPTYCSFPLHVL
jgi:hypothetical protein